MTETIGTDITRGWRSTRPRSRYDDIPSSVIERAKHLTSPISSASPCARRTTPNSTPSMLAAAEGAGRGGIGRRGRDDLLDAGQVRATGRGAGERCDGPLHGLRPDEHAGVAGAEPVRHSGRAGGRRDDGCFGKIDPDGHRRGLRRDLQAQPGAEAGGDVRARLSPDGCCRLLRRHRRGRKRARPDCRADDARLRHCAVGGCRVDAVSAQRRLDQALPGRQRGPQRPRRRDVRQERVHGCRRPDRGPLRAFPRLRAERGAGQGRRATSARSGRSRRRASSRTQPAGCRMRLPTSQPRSTTSTATAAATSTR